MTRRAVYAERIARELLRRYPDRRVKWGGLQALAKELKVTRRRVETVATTLRMSVVGAEASIVTILASEGPVSMQHPAESCAYSRERISKVVRALETDGIVRYERGRGPGHSGLVALVTTPAHSRPAATSPST